MTVKCSMQFGFINCVLKQKTQRVVVAAACAVCVAKFNVAVAVGVAVAVAEAVALGVRVITGDEADLLDWMVNV